MAEKIYLHDEASNTLEPLNAAEYVSEDLLQDLLARYPDLLSGDQIDRESPRRWLLIKREMGVPGESGGGNRWSIDHLFLDQDGIPTLVETKRSSDTRIRREVVGQMLDYAANCVSHWDISTIRNAFEEDCRKRACDPAEELRVLLGEEEDDLEGESFWSLVKTNLEAQRIRLLFVADRIAPELQRIIEFLNDQMERTEVLGIEIRQFIGAGRKTLVPRVVGQTAKAQQAKRSTATGAMAWDRDMFMSQMEKLRGPQDRELAEQIVQWSEKHFGEIWWSTNSASGSVIPEIQVGPYRHSAFRLNPPGKVQFRLRHEKNKPPFDSEAKRREWISRLNEIPGVTFDAESSLGGLPTFDMKILHDERTREKFYSVLEWFISEVKATES